MAHRRFFSVLVLSTLVSASAAVVPAYAGLVPGAAVAPLWRAGEKPAILARGGGWGGGGHVGGWARPAPRPYYGGWRRPAYGWAPGGAIAAGAALGFLSAGAVAAYATPPAAGLCWYYTDITQTQGFWDVCP